MAANQTESPAHVSYLLHQTACRTTLVSMPHDGGRRSPFLAWIYPRRVSAGSALAGLRWLIGSRGLPWCLGFHRQVAGIKATAGAGFWVFPSPPWLSSTESPLSRRDFFDPSPAGDSLCQNRYLTMLLHKLHLITPALATRRALTAGRRDLLIRLHQSGELRSASQERKQAPANPLPR